MFRKPTKRVQARERKKESSEEEEKDVATPILATKKRRKNPLIQSSKNRGEDIPTSSDSDDSTEESPNMFAYSASGTSQSLSLPDQGATKTLDIDTDVKSDAQAQFERVQRQLEEEEAHGDTGGVKFYKGQAFYGAKKAKDSAKGNASSGYNRMGPVRAPQFLRQTVRWDFAPDICKDYKETGFCTFGDSCKFLHDRTDYKHGWEIDRDLAAKKTEDDDTQYEIGSDSDDLPTECPICQLPFVDPVLTRCKHAFCQKCALTAFKKSKRCRVCGENTGGVFNVAQHLLEQKKVEEEETEEKTDKQEMEEFQGDEEEKPEDTVEVKKEPEEDEEHRETQSDREEEDGGDIEFEDAKEEDVENEEDSDSDE